GEQGEQRGYVGVLSFGRGRGRDDRLEPRACGLRVSLDEFGFRQFAMRLAHHVQMPRIVREGDGLREVADAGLALPRDEGEVTAREWDIRVNPQVPSVLEQRDCPLVPRARGRPVARVEGQETAAIRHDGGMYVALAL